MVLSRYLFTRKYINIEIDFKSFFVQMLIFGVAVILSFNSGIMVNCILFVVACIFEVFYNKSLIMPFLKKIVHKKM